MEASPDPDGANEVLARIEGVAAAQFRIEVLLASIQRDLGALTASVDEVSKAQSAGQPPACTGRPAQAEEVRPSPSEGAALAEEREREEEEEAAGEQAEEEVGTQWSTFEDAPPVRRSDGARDGVEVELPPTLPEHWPASVTARHRPSALGPAPSNASVPSPRLGDWQKSQGTIMTMPVVSEVSEPHESRVGLMARIMVDPNSSTHVAYSVISLFMLLHDVLVIPYMLAWDVEVEGIFFVMAATSCCFWTVDVGMSFISGYSEHGRLEMSPLPVARRYARSWLLPDVTIVSCDWLGLVLALAVTQQTAGLRILRFAKLGKLMRLVGLVRMLRVLKRLEDVVLNSLSDTGRTYLMAFLIVSAMFLLNHFFGCAWYALGRVAPSDTGMRWIDMATNWHGDMVPFLASSAFHQYVTSFHWSMAQFTLGSMDVNTFNSIERLFNILCLAIGLIFGSTLVSILSAGMVDHQMAKSDRIQRLRKLRHFLQEHNISRSVAALVQQQARERLSIQPKLQEEDVPALQLLSKDLRTTLRHERFKEHLNAHGLFRLWADVNSNLARELCMEAMDSSALRAQDDLFVPGASAGKAHCVVSGRARYIQRPETAPVLQVRVLPIPEGAWLCEAALWSDWVHVGTVRARTRCQVLSISADGLMQILAKHPLVGQVSAEYCRIFHRRIVSSRPPFASWPDDLEVPLTDYSEMVASMSPSLQVAIGFLALDQSHGRSKLSQERASRLRQEVEGGKCTLTTSAQGQLQRVVSIAAVWMESPEGKVLVEVGRMEAGAQRFEASGQLPAEKQQAGESLGAAHERLLDRFRLRREGVDLVSVEREVEWKDSKAYGVRTKYVRTVHHVRLPGELPLQALALADMGTISTRSEPTASRVTVRLSSLGSEPSVSAELLNAPTFRITCDDEKIHFYAWLDGGTFRRCSTPAGQRELEVMLASLCRLSSKDAAPTVAVEVGSRRMEL